MECVADGSRGVAWDEAMCEERVWFWRWFAVWRRSLRSKDPESEDLGLVFGIGLNKGYVDMV